MKLVKANQKSHLSIPSEWQERFVIKRINDKEIVISLEERNAILKEMARGINFVQVGKYTLMINAIKSIDPFWGPSNIPPCPDPVFESEQVERNGKTIFVEREIESSKQERELWNRIFGKENILLPPKEVKE